MVRDLSQIVTVVTGASSGIGLETSMLLAAEGADVAMAARVPGRLEDAAARVAAAGSKEPLAVPTDVSDRHQVRRLITATLERWGRVDAVVASAGVWLQVPIDDIDEEALRTPVEVGYYGAVYPMLEALPAMRVQGHGHVVFVNSLNGKRSVPRESTYAAAKGALAVFAGAARQELAGTGIEITSVYPGRVDTPLIEDLDVPAIQPKMPPERVARAIVGVLKRPRRDVYLPAVVGRLYCWTGQLAPSLLDAINRIVPLQGRLRNDRRT